MWYFAFLSIMIINPWHHLKYSHLHTHYKPIPDSDCTTLKGIWLTGLHALPKTYSNMKSETKTKLVQRQFTLWNSQEPSPAPLAHPPLPGSCGLPSVLGQLIQCFITCSHTSPLCVMKTPLGLKFFFCSDCFLESSCLHCFYGCPLLERK